MWSSRLFWKLFGAYAGVIVLSAVALVLILAQRQERELDRRVSRRLRDTAVVLESCVARDIQRDDATDVLQPLITRLSHDTGMRITIADLDGNVLADSEQDPREKPLENHKNRPELVQARSQKVGMRERLSPTLGVPMLYFARRVDQGGAPVGLVRLALPTETLKGQLAAMRNLLLGVVAGVCLAGVLLSYVIVSQIIQPIATLKEAARAVAGGDYDCRVAVLNRDEFGELAEAFQRMSRELAKGLEQARQYGQQLEAVLESMVDGVVAVDQRRRVMFANRGACELLGADPASVEQRRLWEIVRHPAVDETVSRSFRETAPQKNEFELAGQSPRQLSLHVNRLPGDPPAGLVLVFHDVTELRRLERIRREFVANVSHELKTPLTSIKAYAETLREGAIHDNEHNVLFVERIERQAVRLEQLILDLLSLARIESDEQPFEIEAVKLDKCIEERIAHHADAAAAKEIALESQPPAQPVVVRAERDSLGEILDNLLDNAIKYTPGGGRVTIRWRADGETAVVEVEDTGIGIAPVDQQRIFERFYRVDKGRSRELGGTGLGLSIVKHLVQAFSGGVTVKSRIGEGSVFVVKLQTA